MRCPTRICNVGTPHPARFVPQPEGKGRRVVESRRTWWSEGEIHTHAHTHTSLGATQYLQFSPLDSHLTITLHLRFDVIKKNVRVKAFHSVGERGQKREKERRRERGRARKRKRGREQLHREEGKQYRCGRQTDAGVMGSAISHT